MAGQYAHVDVTQYLLGPIPTPPATPATDENKNEDDHDNQDQDEDIEEDDNNDIYDQIEIETDNEQDPSNVFVRELNRNKTNIEALIGMKRSYLAELRDARREGKKAGRKSQPITTTVDYFESEQD
ncbi:unnamed protein product [Adineta steineri]|uniref:Uncharacterized protein n=1 Tax=Adineta steineri TaxID=433720 RepID=A0A818LPS7_9BILA|nr:unnamed protein product [Adineta steineri]CAF3606071.1 unnamed protein product [Adineta steineri]